VLFLEHSCGDSCVHTNSFLDRTIPVEDISDNGISEASTASERLAQPLLLKARNRRGPRLQRLTNFLPAQSKSVTLKGHVPSESLREPTARKETLTLSRCSKILSRADSFPSCIVLEANRFKFGTKNAGMVTSEG